MEVVVIQENSGNYSDRMVFYGFAIIEAIVYCFLGVMAIAGGNLIYGAVFLNFVYTGATLEEAARIWPFWPFTISLLWGILLGGLEVALVKISNRLSKRSPRLPWIVLVANCAVLAALASVVPVFTGGQVFPFLLEYLFGVRGFPARWSVY